MEYLFEKMKIISNFEGSKFKHLTLSTGFQTRLNPTHIYTVKKGCENRIFGFPQKYHVKTTQDTTQVTFRVFQAKLGPVNF